MTSNFTNDKEMSARAGRLMRFRMDILSGRTVIPELEGKLLASGFVDSYIQKCLFMDAMEIDSTTRSLEELVDDYKRDFRQKIDNNQVSDNRAEQFGAAIEARGYDDDVPMDLLISDDKLIDVVNEFGYGKTPKETFEANKEERQSLYDKDSELRNDLAVMQRRGLVLSSAVDDYLADTNDRNQLLYYVHCDKPEEHKDVESVEQKNPRRLPFGGKEGHALEDWSPNEDDNGFDFE